MSKIFMLSCKRSEFNSEDHMFVGVVKDYLFLVTIHV